tara:strand:- start:20 stop:229 length:210 start_codon:yes stop_codon:yes gene_type:complete
MKEREYYDLKGELKEVKDLLGEILRRLGTMEYRGEISYGKPNHISDNHTKYLYLNLKRTPIDEGDGESE